MLNIGYACAEQWLICNVPWACAGGGVLSMGLNRPERGIDFYQKTMIAHGGIN
jgi:hypothetical protein